ncbi:hypothetical protein MBR13_005138, partial [Klebsiella pneumoniae]
FWLCLLLLLLMLMLFLFLFLICFSHNLPPDTFGSRPAGAVQSSSHTPLTAKGCGKLRRTRQAVSGYR